MSQLQIAWSVIGFLVVLAALLDWLRIRNRQYTSSEWLAKMRELPSLPPPRRTQEGKPRENILKSPESLPGVVGAGKPAARPRRGRCVVPKGIQEQIDELDALK